MLRRIRQHHARPHGSRSAAQLLAAGAVALSLGLVGSGPAAADTVTRSLRLTCHSQYPDTPITVQVEAVAPNTVPVSQSIAPISITATATASALVTDALYFIGAKSIEGTATATAIVESGQQSSSVPVRLPIPDTRVPASGQITVETSGTTPSWVFEQPGTARIVFSGLDVSITPLDAGGGPITAAVDASCTLDPGQDGVLAPIQVTPVAGHSTAQKSASASGGGSGGVTGTSTGHAPTNGPGESVSARPASGATATSTTSRTASGSPKSDLADSSGTGSSAAAASVGATSSSYIASPGGMDNTRLLLIVAAVAVAAFGASAGFLRLRRRRAGSHESGSR